MKQLEIDRFIDILKELEASGKETITQDEYNDIINNPEKYKGDKIGKSINN